jgi:hypothetical protein
MKKNRIPVRQYLFVQYVLKNNKHLHEIPSGGTLTRGEILGLTTAELLSLNAYELKLVSGDPLNPGIWDLHANKETKTHKTRMQFLEIEKEFGNFYRPLLNRMSGSAAITVADRLVLNIAIPGGPHHKPTTKIQELCYTNVICLGRGDVKFFCRSTSDSSRSSKPDSSNGPEIAYLLIPPTAASGDSNGSTKKSSLPDPKLGFTHVIFTKAIFTLELGVEYAGYTMQYYLRWVNTKYPNLAGTWSVMGSIIVS